MLFLLDLLQLQCRLIEKLGRNSLLIRSRTSHSHHRFSLRVSKKKKRASLLGQLAPTWHKRGNLGPPHYAIDVIPLHKPRAACVAQQIDLPAPPQIYRSPDDSLLAAILIETCIAGNDALPM